MAVYDAVKRQVVLQFACGANSLDDQAGRSDAAPPRVLQVVSSDFGATFSEPTDVTSIFASRVPNPGPGVALQLRANNPHAPGRLIFGGWLPWQGAQPGFPLGKPTGDQIYFSDDNGLTYSLANASALGRSDVGGEIQFTELSNGDVLALLRNEVPWPCFGCPLGSNCTTCPAACHGLLTKGEHKGQPLGKCKAVSRSRDAGLSWESVQWVPSLPTGSSESSVLASGPPHFRSIYVATNANNHDLPNCSWSCYGSANLTLFRSDDGSADRFTQAVSVLGPRGSDEATRIHRSGYSSLAWSAHFPQHIAVLFEIETRDRLWSGGLQLNLIPLSEFGPSAKGDSPSPPARVSFSTPRAPLSSTTGEAIGAGMVRAGPGAIFSWISQGDRLRGFITRDGGEQWEPALNLSSDLGGAAMPLWLLPGKGRQSPSHLAVVGPQRHVNDSYSTFPALIYRDNGTALSPTGSTNLTFTGHPALALADPVLSRGKPGGNLYISWNSAIQLSDGSQLVAGYANGLAGAAPTCVPRAFGTPFGGCTPTTPCTCDVALFYHSVDSIHWTHRSHIATEGSELATARGNDTIGLAEPCIVELKDGRILAVFRALKHTPLWKAISSTRGSSWSALTPMPEAFSVSPSLAVLGHGAVVLVSGRPGNGLWVNWAGDGESWEPYHNLCAAWNRAETDPARHYCAELAAVNRSNRYTMRVDGCTTTTSSSTGVVALSAADGLGADGPAAVLVAMDRQNPPHALVGDLFTLRATVEHESAGFGSMIKTDDAAKNSSFFASLTFEAPVRVGFSGTTHYFFPAQTVWLPYRNSTGGLEKELLVSVSNSGDAATPCTANCSRLMASSDRGRSWRVAMVNPTTPSAEASGRFGASTAEPCVGPGCVGILDSWIQLPERLVTLWVATPQSGSDATTLHSHSTELLRTDDGRVTPGKTTPVLITGLPPLWPNSSISFSHTIWATLGGVRCLLAVGHGRDAVPFRGQNVNKTTVFVFRSDDNGRQLKYLSRVPCTNATSMSPWCERAIGGPSEPTIAQLRDGRLLLLFRTTGTPCMKALSSDGGRSWTSPVLTPIWSVWPQVQVLPNGVLVATSGRPGLGLWWASDGVGDSWQYLNLAAVHNSLLTNAPRDSYYRELTVKQNQSCNVACPSCWCRPPCQPPVPKAGCARETTSYNGLTVVDASPDQANVTVVVAYDRLANGWFGPPGPNGPLDQVFSLRMHFNATDTAQPTPVIPPFAPPEPTPAPAPPSSAGSIVVICASYGANCGQACNFNDAVKTACDGRKECAFTIHTPLKDPCPFVKKDFSVVFACGAASPNRTETIAGEADKQTAVFGCG